MGFGGRGMVLLCVGAVVLQYLFYASIIASHDRLGVEIAAALDTRDSAFVRRLDHSLHSHEPEEALKKAFDVQEVVRQLADQVAVEEAIEKAFEEKLQRIIRGELPSLEKGSPVEPQKEEITIEQRPGRTSCEAEHPTTVFYNRIGKAGSTTLNEWLKKQCRESSSTVVFGTDPESLDRSALREEREIQRALRGEQLTVYISHIYYLDFEKYDYHPSLSYINMMRNPGKRYISQYHFWRTLKDPFGNDCREAGISLESCIEQSHDSVVYTCPMANYQTLYFCGHGPDCVAPATEATFQLAKKHLIENYSTVGVLEEIDLYTQILLKKFPDHFQNPGITTGHAMKTGKRGPDDDQLVALATELNNYDVQLYNIALDLFHEQAANCGLL